MVDKRKKKRTKSKKKGQLRLEESNGGEQAEAAPVPNTEEGAVGGAKSDTVSEPGRSPSSSCSPQQSKELLGSNSDSSRTLTASPTSNMLSTPEEDKSEYGLRGRSVEAVVRDCVRMPRAIMEDLLLSADDVEGGGSGSSSLMGLGKGAGVKWEDGAVGGSTVGLRREVAGSPLGNSLDKPSGSTQMASVEDMLIDFSETDGGSRANMFRGNLGSDDVLELEDGDCNDVICTSYDDNVKNTLPPPLPPIYTKPQRMGKNEKLMLEHFTSPSRGGISSKGVVSMMGSADTSVVYSHRSCVPICSPAIVSHQSASGWQGQGVYAREDRSGANEEVFDAMEVDEDVGDDVTSSEVKQESEREMSKSEEATNVFQDGASGISTVETPTDTYLSYKLQRTIDRLRAENARNGAWEGVSIVSKSPKATFCVVKGCKKKADLECPACKLKLCCTKKHMKAFSNEHASMCNAFRLTNNGKHSVPIAARHYKQAGEHVMCDDPVMIVPLNPLGEGMFPESYCVECFTDHSFSGKEDSEIRENGWKPGTRLCPRGCGMWICQDRRACGRGLSIGKDPQIPSHFDSECRNLKIAMATSDSSINLDQSFVSIIRFMKLAPSFDIIDIDDPSNAKVPLIRMFKSVSGDSATHYVQSISYVLRNVLWFGENVANDETLLRVAGSMQRFGRSCGPDVTAFCAELYQRDAGVVPKFVKCVYPNIGFVPHSCLPNSIMVVGQGYTATIRNLRELKKDEAITICYDDRCLFWPMWKRREYLLEEYGIVCNCNRCTSETEFDTYFSGFVCKSKESSCADKPGFTLPNEAICWSPWSCVSCKSKRISYDSMMDIVSHVNLLLATEVYEEDPIGLLKTMNMIVKLKFVHWDNYLIFDYSIKLFKMLWVLMNEHNMKVIGWYSETRGSRLLQAADVLISLSEKFLPHGYLDSHVLPLRLAAVIKIRYLFNQLEIRQTTINKIDQVVKAIYFRATSWGGLPLYERPCIDGSNPILEAVEMKLLLELNVTTFITKPGMRYLGQMYKFKTGKDPSLACTISWNRENHETFPWNLKV